MERLRLIVIAGLVPATHRKPKLIAVVNRVYGPTLQTDRRPGHAIIRNRQPQAALEVYPMPQKETSTWIGTALKETGSRSKERSRRSGASLPTTTLMSSTAGAISSRARSRNAMAFKRIRFAGTSTTGTARNAGKPSV